MLKIKDNVDLKELEKFEFEYTNIFTYVKCVDKIMYEIDPLERIISINIQGSMLQNIDDTLYDLIQARISGKGGIAWI